MARPRAEIMIRVTNRQVAGFRLLRHHLRDAKPSALVPICRAVCGIQAQMMAPAYLQLWTRNHALSKGDIQEALWQKRTLVKTSLMRQTIHIVPADEFPLYIAGVKSSRIAGPLRIMARCGITPEEAEAMTSMIMEALSRGPLGGAEIKAAVRPQVSKRMRAWMDKVWSILRLPFAEGLVCYGSGEGNEVKFIRVDHWLGRLKPVTEINARCEIARKYLRAYGPATAKDFAHWAGLPMRDCNVVFDELREELVQVSTDGAVSMLLREDAARLKTSEPNPSVANLLPLFDPYLLAHARKEHLLEVRHYKAVYRNQGWISSVILLDGRIVGTWSYKLQKSRLIVAVSAFEPLGKKNRLRIEEEAEGVAGFFGKKVEVRHDK